MNPLLWRALVSLFALTLLTAACRRAENHADAPAAEPGAGSAAEPLPASREPAADVGAPVEVTEANLDAFERGFAKEIEVVRAAKQREAAAATPEERSQAAQAQWEEQTAPEGARAAGLPPEQYRAIRDTVTRVLETLDFQGKIEGPKSIDLERAPPEMRERVARDAYAELPSGSAAALRARMSRLVPLWVEYVNLTAVAG